MGLLLAVDFGNHCLRLSVEGRAKKKTNFAAIKLFETKKENLFQQTKMGLG